MHCFSMAINGFEVSDKQQRTKKSNDKSYEENQFHFKSEKFVQNPTTKIYDTKST